MAVHALQDFIRRLRRTRTVAEGAQLTDAELLERFARQRDEAAFEVLVWRHGALVLALARRLVRQAADAEDVFQATFLTLARKAASIRRGTALGSWLYKVAYRIALRVRQTAARRREQSGIENAIAPETRADDELAALLAEEVSRLPERYRSAVVLCYLQGATTEEAARLLGCPRGTVLSRLSSARQLLRQRLVRRGVAPAAVLAAVSFSDSISAMPPVALVASVIRVAAPFAAGRAASSPAVILAKGALQTMMWNKIKLTVAVVCLLALAGTGTGWLARGRAGAEAPPTVAEKPAEKPARDTAGADRDRKDRIKRLHAELDMLAEREANQEDQLSKEALEARLRLAEAQDELRLAERERDIEREDREKRIKGLAHNIALVEDRVRSFNPSNKEFKKMLEQEQRELTDQREMLTQEWERLRRDQRARIESLRPLRKQVFLAEENQRRLETRQLRHREEIAAKRQSLFSALQQLEEMRLGLEPADQLRDVERKLDALRREIGDLRRALERRKP